MTKAFHSFVIMGAMRTGSNFLEASLGELPGVTTYGEVFNPRFIGVDKATELFGITLQTREKDPARLWQRLREKTGGIFGFRYFLDHDPRMFDQLVADPGCAKIVLSRNPLDSFLSFKIAMHTDEWRVSRSNASKQAKVKVKFDFKEFEAFLKETDEFYRRIRHGLRVTGQSAFEISYDDLADTEVLNGLAAWLGLEAKLDAPSTKYQKQNPPALEDKVENLAELRATLGGIDPFGLDQPRAFETHRNAAIQTYVAAAKAPLLYLPVKGGPGARVEAWLAQVDGVKPAMLTRHLGLKGLVDWRAAHPGFRSFTVVRHPLERAHESFCTHLLMAGPQTYGKLRKALQSLYWFDFPPGPPGASFTSARHRNLFLDFLVFLERNLQGLTSIRIDPAWASQEAVIGGFCRRQIPDRVVRESHMARDLAGLALEVGVKPPPLPPAPASAAPFPLAAIYDAPLEAAARKAYAQDYAIFGFSDWSPITEV